MCAHNGTHVDAPFHFLKDGDTVDKIPLKHFVGNAYVAYHDGYVKLEDAKLILEKARAFDGAGKRILIKGKAVVTLEAAKFFANSNILLLGNESQTIGPEDAPMAVHKALLSKNIVLLEGIRLKDVSEGAYLLSAAPLNLKRFDGAPCRAVLIDTN